MDKSAYDVINDFCENKYNDVLVPAERDYVIRKFFDSYAESIEKYKADHGEYPADEQETTIINSLLIDNNLKSYADSAKSNYEKLVNSIESDFKRKQNRSGFLKNVVSSVLASFIYSIILIVIFWVARDQISTWLMQLKS